MKKYIAHITLLVKDYDEAIEFYTQKLGFILIEDSILSETKRWVLIAPDEQSQCQILLAKAANDEQTQAIGNQSGKRVFLFLYTDDFWRDYHNMLELDINFVRQPLTEEYGTVAVFEDLYGNLWDLIQPIKG
ncbi:VOC family protein [Mucilaginibacter sabulilitoris]|uniref:VOC family protein n=1 Tax=Mucilaginibacter sabulilitoris TaxID=1173583 RepID=A0ABZ0TEF0_9SPHI|nr:VOC family protein [Mucilaginibacter sabulilitoris]WPU91119.1 VOC family protein [Mucilaginibacter sabulilitoris]